MDIHLIRFKLMSNEHIWFKPFAEFIEFISWLKRHRELKPHKTSIETSLARLARYAYPKYLIKSNFFRFFCCLFLIFLSLSVSFSLVGEPSHSCCVTSPPGPGFPLGSATSPLFRLAVLGKCSVLKYYSQLASPGSSSIILSHSGGRGEI